jgi:acyl-CoA thioesterase I
MHIRRHLLLRIGLLVAVASGVACRDADAPRPTPPRAAPAPPPALPANGPSASALIAPNPLISRGKRVAAWSPVRFAHATNVNDGDRRTVWEAGKPTPEQPAWVAIEIGGGPTRVLLEWSAGGSFDYNETDYGSPGSYRIETSASSTDGADGAWSVVASEPSVITHGEARSFAFAGQRWVKMVIAGAPQASPNGVQIDEIEVHDVSLGASDTWFFMGDSITAFAFGRSDAEVPGFAGLLHASYPRYDPAVINGGIGGEKSDDGVRHLDDWLARNPDARFWAVAYGANDAAGDASDTSRFRANLRAMIDRLKSAGRVPILPTIAYASDGKHRNISRFNDVIDELRRADSLPPGPDLYTWFFAHPEELRDGLHPNDRGIASINRLWAEAVSVLYGR